MGYHNNLNLEFNYGEENLSIVCEIDWCGNTRNSAAYLKSVNGLLAYRFKAEARMEYEYAVLHEFDKCRKAELEMQMEARGDEHRGN